MAVALVSKYDMDVVILVEDSIGLNDVTDYADDYFDFNGYGVGSKHSGVLLLLDMDEREWAISTCGDAIDALTDYGQEQIMDEVLEYLGDDEYYNGFHTYLELLDRADCALYTAKRQGKNRFVLYEPGMEDEVE
jgi:uncharacterized protein